MWQFFGVHLMSLSVMYLREKWPECLLHASAEKITVEGATLSQSNVAVSPIVVTFLSFSRDILTQPKFFVQYLIVLFPYTGFFWYCYQCDSIIFSQVIIRVDGAHFKLLQHVGEGDEVGRGGGAGKGALPGVDDGRGIMSSGPGQDPSLVECAISLKLSVEANAETAVAAMEVRRMRHSRKRMINSVTVNKIHY